MLLHDENCRACCEYPRTSKDENVLSDICDGTVFRKNNFFNGKPRVLQLLVFQDAFKTVNPLGSSKTKFKLVAFYFVSANLPTFLSSKTDNLTLILLCREKYINIYGWGTIFCRFCEILRNYLESGNYNINNLRNPENYARCAEAAKKKNAMVKGIREIRY